MGNSKSKDENADTVEYVKVLFCGGFYKFILKYEFNICLNCYTSSGFHFQDGFEFTKEALKNQKNIIIKQCAQEHVEREIIDSHVVVPLMTKITKNLMDKAPYLNLIQQFGMGLEGVDIKTATDLGISVSFIPSSESGNAQSCAEHAIFLSLCLLRRQKICIESINRGLLGYPTGRTLMGSSVLLYGYGNIGKELAKRLQCFGVKKIVAIKRTSSTPSSDDAMPSTESLVIEIGTEKDIDRLTLGVDIVFVCCSQNPQNLGFVNSRFISALNDEAIIINVARVSAIS